MLTEKLFKAYGEDLSESKQASWEELLLDIVERISLTSSQYERINQHYEAVGDILKTSSRLELQDACVFPQGSILSRTVVRPLSDGEVDVDAVAWLPNAKHLGSMGVFRAVHEELEARTRTANGVEAKNRCIRVLYADENPKFHMDITPAVNADGNVKESGHGPLSVPDRSVEDWKPSNPRGFADWLDKQSRTSIRILKALNEAVFAERADVEPLPTEREINGFDPLRACIKLMKRHRDQFFSNRIEKDFKPISVLITTLAGKAYEIVAQESADKALSPMQAILRIVDLMPACFDKPTDREAWVLKNPVDDGENFAEKWNKEPRLIEAFTQWHGQLKMDVRLGLVNFPRAAEFSESVASAFGYGTQTIVSDHVERALKAGRAVPGLLASNVEQAKHDSAVGKVFGLSKSATNKPARPEPLERLG